MIVNDQPDTDALSPVLRADFGTSLRDDAAVLTYAAAAGSSAVDVPMLADRVGRLLAAADGRLSTQESTWALLAAHELVKDPAQSGLTVDGQPVSGPFVEVLENLFPCGSITGAPKLSAMQIIHRLERGPRGAYTGAVGHLEPSGDFRFNVAIRTMVAQDDGRFEMGAGSGLVFDSAASPEYDECRLKLAFLERPAPGFSLFETMAWHQGESEGLAGYLLLERHLERMATSAARLGFAFDRSAAERLLARHAEGFAAARRVKLTLDPHGALHLEAREMPPAPLRWKVALADVAVDAGDPLLAHKTTRRALYDDTRARLAGENGCDEVLFVNRDGYLTEGSFTNLFIARNGRLLTPALRHGLLPGTLRAALIDSGRAYEADLRVEDLEGAERIYLGNSLRGLVESVIQSRLREAAE